MSRAIRRDCFADVADQRRAALVLLDDDLRPITSNARRRPESAGLLPTDPRDGPIPAGAINVAAQSLAAERGIDSSPPRGRMHAGPSQGDLREIADLEPG